MRNLYRIHPSQIAEAVKIVRRYASGFTAADGFDIRSLRAGKKLSRYKREKLQRYYQVIREGLARPHVIMKPRNKTRLLAVQKAAGHQDYPKDLKVAFYPSMSDVKPVFNRKNEFIYAINREGLVRYEIPLDPFAYVTDPDAEIDRIIKATPAQYFEIRNGENTLKESYTKHDLKAAIDRLTARYTVITDPTDYYDIDLEMEKYELAQQMLEDADQTEIDQAADAMRAFKFGTEVDSGHWGNWLTGVVGYYSPDPRVFHRERQAKVKMRGLKQDLKELNRRDPQSPNLKKSLEQRKLEMIQKMNSINLERGLPLIDPSEYGIDPTKYN